MKTIILADPLPLFAEGIKQSLATLCDVYIVGICNVYSDLVDRLNCVLPDMLILDERFMFEPGKKADKTPVWKCNTNIKVIVFRNELNVQQIRIDIANGALGYLLRCVSSDELARAVQEVIQGNIYIQESARRAAMEYSLGMYTKKTVNPCLTHRELQVIQLIVEEYSTQEIATKLYISFNTVESHRKNLILKLGVRNSAGIVREAMRLNLYPNPT